MRAACAALCLVLSIITSGCAADEMPESRIESPPIVKTGPAPATIDDTVQTLVEAAEEGDVDYYLAVTPAADAAGAEDMMEKVLSTDLLEDYASHLTTSSTSARIDYGCPGGLIVSMRLRDSGWVVEGLGT